MSAAPEPREVWRLRPDATGDLAGDGRVGLVEGHARANLGPLSSGVRDGVALILDGGATQPELAAAAIEAGGPAAMMQMQVLLRRLLTAGWLEREFGAEAPLLTVRPIAHVVPDDITGLPGDEPLAFSRFAVLRADEGTLRAESPRVAVLATLHDPRIAALLARMATPVAPDDLDAGDLGLDRAVLEGLLRILVHARILTAPEEEQRLPLARWNPVDLMFHTRTRLGRHLGGYGGTYHRKSLEAPEPAVKPPLDPDVRFPACDLDALNAADPPFGHVIEARRSYRTHDDAAPITRDQLGELLFRAARVRQKYADDVEEVTSRPYPAGGALYELEIYPLVSRADGIDPGLYHYDPEGHTLGVVAEPGPRVQALAEAARHTAQIPVAPQVALLITCRFGRVMWKYESMAYALTLKHVGVLYDALYGAATAMELAPCGLGGGSPDQFAAATGIDQYIEGTVGEFLIGSRG